MISIIIPVYNGARFIKQCYNTLQNQTYANWEAIFINDGSSDNSYQILASICDTRIKMIHKRNEGVAIARMIGIHEATREYITFLDVDDTLEPNALELFVKSLENTNADIVVGGINIIRTNGRIIRRINYHSKYITREKAIKELCNGKLRWQLCGKAFRKSLFKNVSTPSGLRSAEDMAVCMQAVLNANKIIVLKECLYNYIQVSTSVTHSKAKEISYDALKAAEFVERTAGGRMDKTSLNCLYLLIISGALRAGISTKDRIFNAAIKKHGNLKSISRLSHLKAINIGLYKYLRINLARFL